MPNPTQPAAKEETKHTPTPWRRHDTEYDAIVGPDRKAIALVMGRSRVEDEDRANLEFIVLACNSYAALTREVEVKTRALEDLADSSEQFQEYLNRDEDCPYRSFAKAEDYYRQCMKAARAALSSPQPAQGN